MRDAPRKPCSGCGGVGRWTEDELAIICSVCGGEGVEPRLPPTGALLVDEPEGMPEENPLLAPAP